MGRIKIIPDDQIYSRIRDLLVHGGDKAVSFSSVGQAVGLAPATLVQRYASRDRMVHAALIAGWDELDRLADQSAADAPLTAKGALQMLKSLSGQGDIALIAAAFRDGPIRARATAWRDRVQGALALRLGGALKGREDAALLFAAWQGQSLWGVQADHGFRLKDALKRLS